MNTPAEAPKILGLCASLRAGRWAEGAERLAEQIRGLECEDDLRAFLKTESLAHLENFVHAGRSEGKPFDEIYANLKREVGNKGLSNSEVGLSAALWAAKELGCRIDLVSLVDHFPPAGGVKRLETLIEKIEDADAIILATPVYFGDRSSLSASLIELFRGDERLAEAVRGKVYTGVAVGAKRNGGQETALIYQIVDMLNAGMLAVGNDSETTSQYGGTVHAGDVGSAWKDDYGLNTSMGTGRRIARVAHQLRKARDASFVDTLRVGFWVLQDKDGYCVSQIERLVNQTPGGVAASVFDASDADVTRCIACDICPTEVDVDSKYRCIIKRKTDYLKTHHEGFVGLDAVVPVAVALKDRTGVESMYQQFMERTRYLRRGDYVFTDLLTAPLVFEEVGANDSLPLRMLTSTIRHHTVMSRPMIGHLHEGRLLNERELFDSWRAFVEQGKRLATGRLINAAEDGGGVRYNPVGYVLSAEKDKESETLERRRRMTADRAERARQEAAVRLTFSAATP
ncbi:MAG TPA: flavodoxin family protein [Phycisphaerales bacterium]|nr:flavodoxin family protein [Phycisphaerales bacterium]